MAQGVLYCVATPIGNLEDMTARALRVLAEVDKVYAEDTRVTRRLFAHFGIQNALESLHDHNELARLERVREELGQGMRLALVSDAGTPLISDPGYKLVQALGNEGFRIIPVPGASALTAALSVAGLPTDRFTPQSTGKSGAGNPYPGVLRVQPPDRGFAGRCYQRFGGRSQVGGIAGADQTL